MAGSVVILKYTEKSIRTRVFRDMCAGKSMAMYSCVFICAMTESIAPHF